MGRNRKREQKRLFRNSSLDASSFAKRSSWLKFEPKVSNFPVIEATLASITLATIKSLFCFLFLYFFSVTHVRDVENLVMDGNSFALRISCYYGNSFQFSFSTFLLSLVF